MQSTYFIGKKIALLISDPWDFGTECGTGPFNGCIVDIDKEKTLIALDRTIEYSNISYYSALCQIRHEGFSMDDLRTGKTISINAVLLPMKATKLIDVSDENYQKGFGAIGSIERIKGTEIGKDKGDASKG